MKIDFRGLKFQNWLYLMAFSVLILTVLWALQFLLFDSFYKIMKINEIRSIGDKIVAQYDKTDFHDTVSEYVFRQNLRIILIDEEGYIKINYDSFNTDDYYTQNQMQSRGIKGFMRNDFLDFIKVQQMLSQSDTNKISFFNTNEQDEITQTIYAAKVKDSVGIDNYLYISSPVPPIDSTVWVLRTQFILITVILFALSLAAAQWISKKMSKPIISLTKSAEKMAKGELDVNYNDESYTEIQQLASTLKYAADELKALDDYRKEFIANVSHDLKTPLTIIKFYSEMIKDVSGNNEEKREEHCDTIIKETNRLTDMVGEILELSKLEFQNAQITKSEVNLSQCLFDTLESFRAITENENYVFETEIEDNVKVLGDEAMLRRVIYNLISNAVNYTGDDKYVKITLKTNLDAQNVRFEVSDTGKGISKEKLSIIWDRYYKARETHKRAVVGTGLGLSIVKNFLILHNAKYGVISNIGEGSTFWFEI